MCTLKRNGSDYSATILGALFRCGHITIWTDVDGVFSADPRKVCVDMLPMAPRSRVFGHTTMVATSGGGCPGCFPSSGLEACQPLFQAPDPRPILTLFFSLILTLP